MEAQPVKFGGHIQQISWIWSALAWLFPILFIGLIYGVGWVLWRREAEPSRFGTNRANIHDESRRMQSTFEDVAGVDEAKSEVVDRN